MNIVHMVTFTKVLVYAIQHFVHKTGLEFWYSLLTSI